MTLQKKNHIDKPLRRVWGLCSAECGDWLLLCWPTGGTGCPAACTALWPITGESSLLFRVLGKRQKYDGLPETHSCYTHNEERCTKTIHTRLIPPPYTVPKEV